MQGSSIEMECVPYKVAEAITKKVEPTVVSMGSGPGCDAEFLFGCDILGLTKGHIPRHAKFKTFKKNIKNFKEENAFQNYNDVQNGAFPEKKI